MPITDRSQAKEGGWAQVREALVAFEGDVKSAEFDQWGGQLMDDEGRPLPPKEFLEVQVDNVEVLEVTEDLSMTLTDFNFRINCSDFKGSFWVDKFLESADKNKILVPTGLVGKRLKFRKVTLEARDPKYNSTNYVIDGVVGEAKASAPATPAQATAPKPEALDDPMLAAMEVAVGKTEAQFRTAIALDPRFVGNPLLSLAKTGMVTQALVSEGKLMVAEDGKYQKA